MKANANHKSETESQSVGNEAQTSQKEGAFQFKNNRPESALQRKIQNAINNDSSPIQMKKDAAIHKFSDGESGVETATKVIDPKNGSRGLFKFKYTGGNKIDTFNGTNIADPKIAKSTKYDGLSAPNISVAVASHDLGKDYSHGKLSSTEMESGGRDLHFRHADKAHGTAGSRVNSYTWHHLQDKGKMELIDMNVHGAMWHYGGIAGWKGATHSADASDDDPSSD